MIIHKLGYLEQYFLENGCIHRLSPLKPSNIGYPLISRSFPSVFPLQGNNPEGDIFQKFN